MTEMLELPLRIVGKPTTQLLWHIDDPPGVEDLRAWRMDIIECGNDQGRGSGGEQDD